MFVCQKKCCNFKYIFVFLNITQNGVMRFSHEAIEMLLFNILLHIGPKQHHKGITSFCFIWPDRYTISRYAIQMMILTFSAFSSIAVMS